MESKKWYMSKTVWAAVISGVISLTGAGLAISDVQMDEITTAIVNIAAAISTGIAVYGRVTAETKIE